jgi:ribose transport system permease protein
VPGSSNTVTVGEPSSDATRSGPPRGAPSRAGRLGLNRFTGLFLWAALIVVFAIWIPDTFLTGTTVKSIAADQAITAILAVGILFALAADQYDLSVAQNLGFSCVVTASLVVKSGMGVVPAALITIAIGALIGIINGVVVAGIGVNSFIATLGMTSVLLALTQLLSDNQYIGPIPQGFQDVVNASPLGIPAVTIYAIVLAVLIWAVLEHTPLGRRTYATGANPDAARLAGVPVRRHVFSVFVVSGVFAALAGVLLSAKIGQVAPDQGPPYLLPTFAACFLGTTQFKLGRFNVWGTLLALYLLATGVKGLQLAGGEIWITDLFNGVALVAAVSLAVLGQKRRDARIKARTRRRALRRAAP